MIVTVFLASALICTATDCYPALVGKDTPIGEFPLNRRYVEAKGYGGDVLQFKETRRDIFAIHRVWLGNPKQRRQQRLTSGDAAARRFVTNGCINVMPEVYALILAADTVTIKP